MTYKKKLIEVALPLATINAHAAKQKSMGAAPHPQNLHRWFARRPFAATRAVLWASLAQQIRPLKRALTWVWARQVSVLSPLVRVPSTGLPNARHRGLDGPKRR